MVRFPQLGLTQDFGCYCQNKRIACAREGKSVKEEQGREVTEGTDWHVPPKVTGSAAGGLGCHSVLTFY